MMMESESRDHHQHQAEVCTGTHQSDYTFKEEHVPGLAEALAGVAHKWEVIALALRLPEAVRAECGEGSILAMKLYRVLYQWIVGQHSNAKPATRENLKTALASPLVQHPQLASELEDKLKTSLSSHTLTTSQKESIFQSIFQSGVREVLAEKYSQCPEVPCGSWPPVVSKTFINLALIETSGQPLKSDYSIRGDADDVLAKKTQVQYEDVFKTYERKKKLLILGRPGSGKTTLVHKLVRDWSAGKALQGAELVFLISLRMLSSESDKSLPDILQNLFFDKTSRMQVCEAIERAQGEGVCFIFDGFDEYSSSCKPKSVIFALLDKSYLVDAMIIVTSRPAAASAADKIFDKPCKKIEVFGFSKSQISEYINCFPFSSLSSANEFHSSKLQKFLSSHPGVLDLCYLPVNCAIMCFIYDTEPDHLPDTQTQIYALFTRLIIIRQLTSRDISRQLDSLEDLEGQEAEDFKKLCSLAFDMTTHSQQVVTRGPASIDEAHSLGFITTDITAGLSGYKNSYSFLHLTLQEFLAAYHLSKLSQEEQMSLIENYSKSVHMLNVWKLYCGLVKFETGTDRAKKLFCTVSNDSLRVDTELFRVHCSYEAKQNLISWLASSESFAFRSATDYDISAIAYTMSMAATEESLATPTKYLTISFGCLNSKYTLKMFISELNNEALKYLEELIIENGKSLSTADLEVLANKLTLSREQTKQQALNSLKYLCIFGEIGDEGVAVLATGLKCNNVLEKLTLFGMSLSTTAVSVLMKSAVHLRTLRLTSNNFGDECAATLAAGLDGNHVLETLQLAFNFISATGVRKLIKADCHLQHLDLSHNNIGDEGAIAVAEGLRGNLTLKSIDLLGNNIGASGVEALALILQHTALNLKLSSPNYTLPPPQPSAITSDTSNLSENRDLHFHDVEVNQLQSSCNLQELSLDSLNCDAMTIISKFALLFHLVCDQNNLPEAIAIVDYVAKSDNCHQLRYLGLSSILHYCTTNLRNLKNVPYRLFSGFIIDMSYCKLDKAETVSFIQAIKKYDRVGAVYLIDRCFDINVDITVDLISEFQHDRIDRLIILNTRLLKEKLYFSVLSCSSMSKSKCAYVRKYRRLRQHKVIALFKRKTRKRSIRRLRFIKQRLGESGGKKLN